MWAIFHFLIDYNLNKDDETNTRDVIAEIEAYCEENLYEYDDLAVVLENGRAIDVYPAEDGKGEKLIDIIQAQPERQRWEWARLHALQSVAQDLGVGGRPWPLLHDMQEEYWKSFDTLLAQTIAEVPPRLAALWAEVPILYGDASIANSTCDDLDCSRNFWSSDMTMLLDSIRCGKSPFTSIKGPFFYRAFDLTQSEEETKAILLAHIHL